MPYVLNLSQGLRRPTIGGQARRSTAASAVPFIPPPMGQETDAPTIVCATVNGVVQCTDEGGKALRGKELEKLQQLLKPITDAPPLTDRSTAKASSKAPEMVAANIQEPTPTPSKPQASTVASTKPSPAEATPVPSTPVAETPRLASNTEPSGLPAPSSTPAPRQAPTPPPTRVKTISSPGNVDPSAIATLPDPDNTALTPGNASPLAPGNNPSPSISLSSVLTPGNVADDRPLATVSSPATPIPSTAARVFPGNVDPNSFFSAGEFDGVAMSITNHTVGTSRAGATIPKTMQLVNDKGLIPGNVPPEVGDIVSLLEQVNARPVTAITMQLIPGNIPPDAAPGTIPSFDLELSPANIPGKEKVSSLTMQLVPGNIAPEVESMLGFLAQADSKGMVAAAVGSTGDTSKKSA